MAPGQQSSKDNNQDITEDKSLIPRSPLPLPTDKLNLTHLNLEEALKDRSFEEIRDSLSHIACSQQCLQHLNLSRNRLMDSHLQDIPFHLLADLRHLNLSRNSMSEWPRNFLRFNSALEVLDIRLNYLRSLPGVLLHLPHLNCLRREDNCLPTSYNRSASESARVTRIHLHNNRNIPRFGGPTDDVKTVQFSLQALSWAVAGRRCPKDLGRLPMHLQLHFTNILMCDSCFALIVSGSPYSVLLFLPKFAGIPYLAILATACSTACASQLFERWDYMRAEAKASGMACGRYGRDGYFEYA